MAEWDDVFETNLESESEGFSARVNDSFRRKYRAYSGVEGTVCPPGRTKIFGFSLSDRAGK